MNDRPGREVPTLASRVRPLTDAERRLLRARARDIGARGRAGRRVLIPGAVIVGGLWGLTLLASDAPALVITLFWVVVGGGILLGTRHSLAAELSHLDEMAWGFESALRRDEAEVVDVRARAFVEFEEFEDEGACYAFAIDGGRLVFVCGQEFYPESKFPSLDFSLVHFLDEAGRTIDAVIEKRGPRATPVRTIPAARKMELELPEHLEVIEGSLEDLARE